ncbi:MAG: PHP domain-containing protein, partial [Bacillota bacterium]
MQLIADYHTHTYYSHGQGSIAENIEVARAKGLKEIAIADHGPRSYSFRQFGVKEADTLLEIKRKIDRYNEVYSDIKVLAAVEANIINLKGELDVPRDILEELDKVLVGFHLFVKPTDLKSAWGIIINNLLSHKFNWKDAEVRKANTELLLKTIDNYSIDIITHPGYQVDIDTRELAQAAAEAEIALEINAKHGFLTEEFVKTALKEGVKFSLGSDAHFPQQVGEVASAFKLVKQLG